jgi:hypothetical protein
MQKFTVAFSLTTPGEPLKYEVWSRNIVTVCNYEVTFSRFNVLK